jgi:hypothetical protein
MGVSQAVGPVSAKNGLLNPLFSAIERAMRPVSAANFQWSRAGSNPAGYTNAITVRRMHSATVTINKHARRAFTKPPGAFAFAA